MSDNVPLLRPRFLKSAAFLLIVLFGSTCVFAQNAPFITTWQTSTDSESITIPTTGDGYAFTVDWGDDSSDATVYDGDATHTYTDTGTYTISISGDFPRIFFDFTAASAVKIQTIEQWGDVEWSSMNNAFAGCHNLVLNAQDEPDLSKVTDLSGMFNNAFALNEGLENWDVSNVTDMNLMFSSAFAFNGDLSGWDVSSVQNMFGMFRGAESFNQDLSKWDVGNVTNLGDQFNNASSFNGDLSTWNVGKVTDMALMFSRAGDFTGDLSNWDVSQVTDMSFMFYYATSFNSDVSGWDVGNVTDMTQMFNNASAFNQNLSDWDVSQVTDMSYMFSEASVFAGDLAGWDVSQVTSMAQMFNDAIVFNGDLSSWDVSSVDDMTHMFQGATAFDQDLSSWNVSNVTDMSQMFSDAVLFNGDVSTWNVSQVRDLSYMFFQASSFDKDLSTWDISEAEDMSFMLFRSALSVINYDSTLIGWSRLDENELRIPDNMTFYANGLSYCLSEEHRSILMDDYGWTILGDVKNCEGIEIEEVLGIDGHDDYYSIYPNPAKDIVTVEFSKNIKSVDELTLLDLNGVELKQLSIKPDQSSSRIQVDISMLSSGVYLLKFATSTGTITERVIKP